MILPRYGELYSVRHQARRTMDLLNSIAASFGKEIRWPYVRGAVVILKNGQRLHVNFRGNKYADYLQLWSIDIEVLKQIKAKFPEDFKVEVLQKEGILE